MAKPSLRVKSFSLELPTHRHAPSYKGSQVEIAFVFRGHIKAMFGAMNVINSLYILHFSWLNAM